MWTNLGDAQGQKTGMDFMRRKITDPGDAQRQKKIDWILLGE